MQVLTPGHKYQLDNFENKGQPGQIIQFIEKEPVTPGSRELKTVNDGTTNGEVLKMLIDRSQSLYNKFPSDETFTAINHLKQALYALQSRTYERSQRGVEGKAAA